MFGKNDTKEVGLINPTSLLLLCKNRFRLVNNLLSSPIALWKRALQSQFP